MANEIAEQTRDVTVSGGMVYMRPLRLIGLKVAGAAQKEIVETWTVLNEWVLRKGFSREVELGYGLTLQSPKGPEYLACIEVPSIATNAEANELKRTSLEGGAYFRQRFSGPLSAIPGQFDALNEVLMSKGSVGRDVERPLVTVMLDIKGIGHQTDIRSNLLIPVCNIQSPARQNAVAGA